jgi:AhpC/TSA family
VPVRASGPFPRQTLPALAGNARPLAEAWSGGEALILLGHRSCKTTRQTLPFVDRIHRNKSKGTVLAVLQDDPATAATLVKEQGLSLPVLLESDPYPLAAALSLEVVPTAFLVSRDGAIEAAVQGFNRDALESLAARLGVVGGLFRPEDKAPAFTPG